METLCFRLKFNTPVHFGEGRLGDQNYTFDNQRLFSALYNELLRHEETLAETFLEQTKKGKMIFSDAFPYVGDSLYVPRPQVKVKFDGERNEIKALKNLNFIPVDGFEDFLAGKMNPLEEKQRLSKLGVGMTHQRVNLKGEQSEPYFVGSFTYSTGSGLYILFSYEKDDDLYLFDDAMTLLGSSGIGGKRTSGYGKFEALGYDLDKKSALYNRLNMDGPNQMTLGFSVPSSEEWGIIDQGQYKVVRKSGFIHSEMLDSPVKKKRIYGIRSGSIFQKQYQGSILNVGRSVPHPVYLYAKPMWMEVSR